MSRHGRIEAKENMQTAAQIVDKLMKEIDPEVVLAGMLGAIAARGGITPPLTMLLKTLNKGVELDDAGKAFLSIISPVAGLGMALSDLFAPPKEEISADEQKKKDQLIMMGCMASGAMEGMIMMTLVKNKDLMRQLTEAGSKLGSAAITAAGEAVPF